ncbi:Fic family protein [Filimonas effusa]|uniref:Cell filamentation protein Fic n=1 Tax=Filimonas effusa TaxID=2508721 RepID=A0A4Q1D2T9_9BACT|nr:Fic family protein [Filimonas effusa]RXK81712.1 cell filamentation protein Fic [Filimonas effusa]
MATPNEKFAEALQTLKNLQDNGVIGIHTNDLPPMHRIRLTKYGFLSEVTRGWYIATNPKDKEGETTAWYSSYWEFLIPYLRYRFGENWCLSAEQSLLIHAGNWAVPKQLLVRTPDGNNRVTPLPHETSLFSLKTAPPPDNQTVIVRNMRLYNLPASLIYSAPTIFTHSAIDARTALSMIRDASEVLQILLDNGHTTLAGRLAGAFRNIQRDRIADQIIETFKQADYNIREEDPFETKLDIKLLQRERSPYANRMRLMWMQMRETVIAHFPAAPGLPANQEDYLKEVDDIYVTDAYHSLSIERYRVSPELIERVSSGEWGVGENEEDRKQKDAMAARGYYQAFLQVKQSIKGILKGANAGEQVNNDHVKWYRELFDPGVAAGIVKASDLAGYRNQQVFISNSKHVPLEVDSMRDAMPVLFELLTEEKEASVRAVLGHFLFVFIHPYMDGNGRIGRYLMNTMLASGGYPWTVIPVERRSDYMQALESASVQQNIEPFARFVGSLVQQRIEGKTVATLPT